MPRPKAHSSVLLRNHETGEQIKLELIDLPFAIVHTYRPLNHGDTEDTGKNGRVSVPCLCASWFAAPASA